MQGKVNQANSRIPYSKWIQHRAHNGMIYLAHPHTGETKWLWSRYTDPKTSKDYLVNTVTGDRRWATSHNGHVCPAPSDAHSSPSQGPQSPDMSSTTNLDVTSTKPTEPQNPKISEERKEPPYKEVPAPKSLGLTADEVLMQVVATGKQYVYNKKTKRSRWLPDRLPDTPDGSSRHSEGSNSQTNGYPTATRPVYTSDEAAQVVQRAFRAKNVRNANILGKLRTLTDVLAEVRELTVSGKYDMNQLRTIAVKSSGEEERKDAAQRLLELGEYLTQQMLKVDAVESAGNQLVRGKRKLSVKVILSLTDEVDGLRKKLKRA